MANQQNQTSSEIAAPLAYDDVRAEVRNDLSDVTYISITDTHTREGVLLTKDEAIALRDWLRRVLL